MSTKGHANNKNQDIPYIVNEPVQRVKVEESTGHKQIVLLVSRLTRIDVTRYQLKCINEPAHGKTYNKTCVASLPASILYKSTLTGR